MKKIGIVFFIFYASTIQAQELFTFTEPASNMAAKAVGVRLNNYFMKDLHSNQTNYHLLPEVMIGLSKKIMVHAEAFLSNRNNIFVAEGGSVYIKYRILSVDDVHSHFRVAAYGRYSMNNSSIHQPAIDFQGHSSGYETGVVATKLLNKFAFSTSTSILHATDNGVNKFLFGEKNRTAVNYTLSIGKLMLPKEYISYKQVNVNAMLELLGQINTRTAEGFTDIAPSLQFIVNSRLRMDIGYRIPINTTLHRTAPEGFLIRAEYNFFSVFK
jgi:hypothetical protein